MVVLTRKVEARRCQSFYKYMRRDCCIFVAWGRLEPTSRLHASAGPDVILKRKSRIEGCSVISSQQLVPKLTRNIHPIKVELLCHSCTYCCVLHIPKSIFLHDLQRPNACSFEMTSRLILQCIELHLNRSFCILDGDCCGDWR
jgi:hypothetical protein